MKYVQEIPGFLPTVKPLQHCSQHQRNVMNSSAQGQHKFHRITSLLCSLTINDLFTISAFTGSINMAICVSRP